MGLDTNKKSGNNIYLKIMNGKLVQTVTKGTEGAVARMNKEGVEVHELLFTGLTGKITNAAIIDGKFGKELEIKFLSDGVKFVVQTSASGGYAYGFFTRMAALDLTKETELRTYAIEDKASGKTNHVIVLYQGGEKVASVFTKENNYTYKGATMPALEKLKDPKDPSGNTPLLFKGKEVWDDTNRLEFWTDIIYGEGGINDELIKLYGSAEDKAATEDKNDFTDDVDAPTEESETEKMNAEADAQKASAAAEALELEALAEAKAKKAAAKKATTKKK